MLLILVYTTERLAPKLLPLLERMLILPQGDARTPEAWLPLLAAMSLLVGSIAAFMLALRRMLHDFRGQPCLGLGAAMVATIGFVLIALRAPISLYGLPSTTLAVTSLSLSLLGAAWAQYGGILTALLGALMAAAPLAVVLLAVGAAQLVPVGEMVQLFSQLAEIDRLFLILLTVAGVLMISMALLARALLEEHEPEWSGYEPDYSPAKLAVDPRRFAPADSFFGAAAVRASRSFLDGRARLTAAGTSAGRKLKTLWNSKAGDAPPLGFNAWSYHDSDAADEAELELSLRRSASLGPWLLWAFVIVAALAVALWAAYS